MALAAAYDEAKANEVRRERSGKFTTDGVSTTAFFSFPDDPELPHATLAKHDPGRFSSAHYHVRDQFQVIVDGRAKFGRHDALPYCVHFARAYTPYGPLRIDEKEGLTFFVMRAHRDAGAQRLADKQDLLRKIPDRRPWQMTRRFDIPTVPEHVGFAMQPHAEMQDSTGLATYSLNMKPDAHADAPDASQSDGSVRCRTQGEREA